MYKIILIILLSSLLFYSNCFAKDKTVKNKLVKTQTKVEKRATVNVVTVKNTAEFRQALENASANGRDDIIILDAGIYKTTDDGLGTFKFSDNESFNLTIKAKDGLSSKDVTLDGAKLNQVFNYKNTGESTLTFERITIINGKGQDNQLDIDAGGIQANKDMRSTNVIVKESTISNNAGVGISCNGSLTVYTSNISNNAASGIYADVYSYGNRRAGNLTINKSTISDNKGGSYQRKGGAVYAAQHVAVEINSSTIANNEGSDGGIYFYDSLIVNDSTIENNTGGGIYGISGSRMFIKNSKVAKNTAGIVGYNVLIINTVISAHSGGAIDRVFSMNRNGNFTVINSIIANNTGSGVSGAGLFINNIFYNNTSDIHFNNNSTVYNNYIDYKKLKSESNEIILKKNNVQPSSGILEFNDEDFRPNINSITIDKGLDPNSDTFKELFKYQAGLLSTIQTELKTDKDGNKRVIGPGIDLGPYEFDPATYKPTVEKKSTAPSEIKPQDSKQGDITNGNISAKQKQTLELSIGLGSIEFQICMTDRHKPYFEINNYYECQSEAIAKAETNTGIKENIYDYDAFILGIIFSGWQTLIKNDKLLRVFNRPWDDPQKTNEAILSFTKNIKKKLHEIGISDDFFFGIKRHKEFLPDFKKWSSKIVLNKPEETSIEKKFIAPSSEPLTAFDENRIKTEINRGSSVAERCISEKLSNKYFEFSELSEYIECADKAKKETAVNGANNDTFLLGIFFRVWTYLVIADEMMDKSIKWDNTGKANETIKAFLEDIRKKQQQFKLTDKNLCDISGIKYEKFKPFFVRWSL